jgi:PhnB protein
VGVARLILEAFEGEELERLTSATGAHVEIKLGDSVLVLEEAESWPTTQPRQYTYVYLQDVDAAFASAIMLGAEVIAEPADKPYQERTCALRDGFGNTWYLATYLG